MQRTFITELPDTLEANQITVDLPRYELPLIRALLRKDLSDTGKFANDDYALNIVTTVMQIKTFVGELSTLDKDMADDSRLAYTNYVGIQFTSVGQAVAWARTFVQRHFPATEERLLKRTLLTIPLNKTEIVWLGPDRYLPFIEAIATSPSSDELVQANVPQGNNVPTLTREEASKKRAELAAKKGKISTETSANS